MPSLHPLPPGAAPAPPAIGQSSTGGVLAAAVVGLWTGERLVYRADAYAAGRTDRETVEAAIRRFADLNDAPMEWGRFAALRRMEPPLARRIDRLRDRASWE
ncbi:hypothetical protein ACFQMA_13360 [Halosimplex aquaticum]|uniref:Uncharacterized protein n=1 Tax=Halosimplex aquaticum TaxID=3026162 RepID=A0ABD5Y1J7_9EURY|nr:hypothetical protein [Halosimplex aquaticum]